MSRLLANSLLLLAGLVWGLGFVAQASAMQDIGPFQFVGFRFLIATLVVAPFAWREGAKMRNEATFRKLNGNDILSLTLVGSAFFTMMILQQVGMLATTVTNAGMLTGLYVIFTPILTLLFLREAQPVFVWPAAAVAFLGIWLLGGGGLSKFTWGDAVVVLSAVFAAMQMILVAKIGTQIGRPILLACSQFAVAAVAGLIGLFIVRMLDWSYEPALSMATLLSAAPEILYAAIFAGGLAFTLQAIGQQHTSAAEAAILLSSEALFAALGGAVLLAERLDLIGYMGCACLLAAIVAVAYLAGRMEDEEALA